MTRAISLPVSICLALAVSGCSYIQNHVSQPGSSAEFIAGNSTEVLIDIRHGPDAELNAARALATQKCSLFGKSTAVLQSVNPVSDGKDRASFACQ
jgi:hypothetical protein